MARQKLSTRKKRGALEDLAITRQILDRRKASPPRPKFRETGNAGKIEVDHESEGVGVCILMNALGSSNGLFTEPLTRQLLNIASKGETLTANDVTGVVAMVQGIGPKDETEAMLAAQMVAIHNATMTAACQLLNVATLPQQDSASNMLNKLARTFAVQIEALKRYRSTGEQSIRVQHVTVNDGGKAIVGTVQAAGRGTNEIGGQPHGLSGNDACSPALLGNVEAVEAAMPCAGREGAESVLLPRGPRWSA